MQRSIIVPVLTRDNSPFRCDQECGGRIRTGTKNALVIEVFSRSEEDGGEPGRQDYRIIDGPSDGQSYPGHNGIDSLFSGHSFCFLPHGVALQQVFHLRDKPKASLERYPESIDVVEGGGLKGRIACHFLMVN